MIAVKTVCSKLDGFNLLKRCGYWGRPLRPLTLFLFDSFKISGFINSLCMFRLAYIIQSETFPSAYFSASHFILFFSKFETLIWIYSVKFSMALPFISLFKYIIVITKKIRNYFYFSVNINKGFSKWMILK